MQIEIKIDEKCKEPKIIVMTDKMTDEVNAIIKRLSDEQPQVIVGFREDVVEVLEPSEIYRVFAESGKVFAETNSVLNQYVAEIRDVAVQGDRMRFRRNIERIGEIMAYEMSKELTYSVKQVQTPLGVASVSTPDDEVVIATVFRAGLPLHTGFLNMFDHAGNAFVSAYRYYKDKECRTVDVHIEYIATPDLSKKTLLIVDPMLATGESMELAWKAFVTKGMPAKLQIACVIASQQGVEHLEKLFPGDEVTLWCAAIDPEMNEHSYIVPGLGDAGDLAFGDKI